MSRQPLILVVEDDRRLAQLVKEFLEAHNFQVAIEEHGNRVVRQVQNLNPSLIVLDVMLPGKDGLTLCKALRPEYRGPIVMLTARDGDADQILGFDYGADDYVTKPVAPRVLLARIRALLRRYDQHAQSELAVIEHGQLKLVPHARQVTLHQREVMLSSYEFDLLLTLASQAGQVLSREFLFSHIYQREYDGLDRTIDVRISQLRKKLGDNAENPSRIKTIWGKGYVLISDAWV